MCVCMRCYESVGVLYGMAVKIEIKQFIILLCLIRFSFIYSIRSFYSAHAKNNTVYPVVRVCVSVVFLLHFICVFRSCRSSHFVSHEQRYMHGNTPFAHINRIKNNTLFRFHRSSSSSLSSSQFASSYSLPRQNSTAYLLFFHFVYFFWQCKKCFF